MKKTFRSILAGALALLAVSCYDDSALRSALASLESRVAELEVKLNTEVGTLNSKFDGLEAAYKLADKNLAASIQSLTSSLDALDGTVDGLISDKTDILAAIEDLKKADKNLADKDAELLAQLVGIGVSKVAKNDAGNVVLTFVDNSTLEIPTKPQEGLVTVLDVDGVDYWAVVVNGEKQSLGVKVGHPSLEFEVDPETNELLYSVDGGEFEGTGAFVAADQEHLLTEFYQGAEFDYDLYEEVVDDFYTLVFGGVEYKLPLYKVDNSVIALKAGKTYFEFGAEKTIDVVISDITSIYVMSKPDGWRAKYADKKLTVTAPAEAAVLAGYAEADGEVLLHCTTTEGKCKIAKLTVATTSGFSLVVTKDGKLTITNPEVVTMTDRWGEEMTDFNDALVGLAPVASFEANPMEYVKNIDNNWDDKWYYLSNWKMNTAEMDEDWNMIYTIGGAYKPGVYEVDVIETTVPKMYADWTYGGEIPAEPFVVWACPMNESGMPRIEDLVYAYYYPQIKAVITEVSKTTSDVEVSVNVVGTSSYYVGLVAEEQLYGFPIDQYMQMQEGPFGYFQMALQYGMADYAFQQMGTPFGGAYGEEMPETTNASVFNSGQPLMPNTKFYMWVFPVVEGLDLADYTYEENLKPYIYEFTTGDLTAGGSVAAVFGEADITFSSMNVELSADGAASMIYYNFFDLDTFNAFETDDDIAAALRAEGYVIAGDMGTAVNQAAITPGSEFMLATLAVDTEGKYGDVKSKGFAAPTLEFSETFTASFGESKSSVYYSGYRYDFPINVVGGEAAKYYYVWSNTEYTDEQLANLPLSYEYDYNFRSTTNVAAGQLAGQYANASSTYYLAVVVESTTGELSAPIKMTVEVPAVPAE